MEQFSTWKGPRGKTSLVVFLAGVHNPSFAHVRESPDSLKLTFAINRVGPGGCRHFVLARAVALAPLRLGTGAGCSVLYLALSSLSSALRFRE